ncbi:MAG: hypothetical protein EXR07_17545 [Acetobacteraceae bacterium]|nr:hypothetical protein [Acetobacteraceae bacterium]
MRWPWLRRACLLGALLPALAVPVAGHAQVETREGIALQNQLYQLKQEIQVLRADVARAGGGNMGGGGGDIAAQLLSRVQAMEEQLRQLRGRIDETQNLVNRQHADVLKRIDDLTFQLNLPGRGAAAPAPAPAPFPAPPPVREVTPRPEPARPPEPIPARPEPAPKVVIPAPVVIPMPPPPPPRSFTFNQIPEPMREAPPVVPTPAPVPAPVMVPPPAPLPRASVDPVRPVPRPAEPVPAPAPTPLVAPRPVPAPAPAAQPDATPLAPIPPGGKRTPEMALQEGHAALARRDYAGAERAAREVMGNRASPRVYDGQFLLAQSLAGQKQFAQAAIAFDDSYNRAHKGRHAQDSLLGLASALTAINEKRAACDTLGRLRTEFAQVRADLQDTITKTNERAGCGR